MTKNRFIVLLAELRQVQIVEGQDFSFPAPQADPKLDIGRHPLQGPACPDREQVQQRDLVRQDGRAGQFINLRAPCLYREFPGRKPGEFAVVVLHHAGNVLHREGDGRIVQAEEQDRVHRPGRSGDQVLDAHGGDGEILDLRDVTAGDGRQDRQEQGSDPYFPPKLHAKTVQQFTKIAIFSDNHLVLLVHRPEFPRRGPALGLEDAVEIGQVVEAALVADFGNVPRRVHQQPGGVAQLDVDQVVRQRPPRAELEKAAEGRRAHAHHRGQVRQLERLQVMRVDVLLDFHDPAALGALRRMGKGGAGEDAGLVGRSQLIEQQEELEELPETVLLRRECVDDVIDLDDVRHREGQAVLRLLQHLADGGELVLGELLRRKHVPRELDRDLPDVLGLALPLLPGVLQVGPADEDEVVVPDRLHAVAHDAAHSGAPLDEVQLELLVLVHRIGEFGLVPLHDVEEVLLRQRGDLFQYVAHDSQR